MSHLQLALSELRLRAPSTWTLAPRRCAATSALAMSQSSNDQVAMRIRPLPASGSPKLSRTPPQTPWIENSTRFLMAIFACLPRLGNEKCDPAGG